MRVPSNPLVLIGPTILLIFALSFLLAWWRERKQRYLLFFAVSCLLFCLGTSSQLFAFPPGHGPNAVVSAFLYTLSVLVLSDGLLRRSGKRLPLLGHLAGLVSVVVSVAYFYYIDRQLLMRIYILNFGLGLILSATAWKLRHLRLGRASERFLFWILLAFAVHFFPRTVLTVGSNAPAAQGFGFSPFWLALQFSLAILGVALALALLAVTIGDTIEVLRRERATDPLTGLLNRRGFDECVISHLRTPNMRPVSLVVADIDHFKNINDAFGHQVGDKVLSGFGRLLLDMLGQAGICGRLGGEEFVVLMPNCGGSVARAFAERLRHEMRDNSFDGLPAAQRVTVSLGVAEARSRESVAELIARADAALYAAKRAGRDCVKYTN
jgi:diguanylate cyclase (GGDEF)-like protein